MNELIAKVTDRYERIARLYPALLALSPLIVMFALLYGGIVPEIRHLLIILASCGGVYLLTSICRGMGARLEPKLFKAWGGKPSTQLLRHRNITIDGVTKLRYHSFLADKIKVPFPDLKQEANNLIAADEVYQSAVRWLLNHTRDKKQFKLLFEELISYGFCRNSLGLKPVGLAISFISCIAILVDQGVLDGSSKYFFNLKIFIKLPETAIIAISISIIMFLVWTFFFTKERVRIAAFTYAEMLLRACDLLDEK